MANPHHRRAADLFKAGLDLDPVAQTAFLDAQCAGDAALRREVESLLAADRRADVFLSTPPDIVRAWAAQADALIGQEVGGYRVVRRIAAGGMGTVYEALDVRLDRTVALKVIRGGLTTASAFSRFEFEAKFLARLRHPAIAHIYEAGTHCLGATNVPYFAMEYVPNARTLVEYARECELTTPQRLELFVQACDAVQYAHQHGVIHRDLKPTNILVGKEASPASRSCGSRRAGTAMVQRSMRPYSSNTGSRGDRSAGPAHPAMLKVIDFGVARWVESDASVTTMHTAYGLLVGTLQYMSPEQCGSDPQDLDVRSDVYSLGVMLYELLAGQPPYPLQGLSLPEATRIIREESPPRLSAVNRRLRGELDTIAGKALEKDRDRRYSSAAELSDDIRRFLRHEPIAARPPTMTYQLRTFARRNKAMVVGLAAVLLVLVGGMVTTSWQAARARASERTARENLRESLLAQARARRQTLSPGRRTAALAALSQAAAIRPGEDLRDEVMTTLAVPDVVGSTKQLPGDSAGVIFSRDLSCYAVLLADRSIRIVGMDDGLERARIPAPRDMNTSIIKWWCDSRFLIRLFDRESQPRRLEAWRIPEGDLLVEVADVPDRASFDVSPDGTTLAVGRMDHAIHLYDLSTGQETRRIVLDRDPSYLQFDPSGRWLARFHARDVEASVLDLETLASALVFEGSDISYALAWSPDGKCLAGSDDYLIRLWDVAKRREIAILPGHEARIVHLAFSHDSRWLASSGWDGASIIWDLTTLRPLIWPGMQLPVFGLDDRTIVGVLTDEGRLAIGRSQFLKQGAYSIIGTDLGTAAVSGKWAAVHPDGRVAVIGLVSRADGVFALQFVDVRRRACIGRVVCPRIGTARFDPAGTSFFATGDQGLMRWPCRIDATTIRIGPPELVIPDAHTEQFDLSADGGRVASVSWGAQTLTILDVDRPEMAVSFDTLTHARSVAISPDGKRAAVTAWQGAGCEIWDVDSGVVVARPPINSSALPAFSPDGRWLAIREWGKVSVLRPGTWDVVHQIKLSGISRVGFSRDSRVLVGSDERSTVHLIDLETGRQLAAFQPPESFAACDSPSFTPDGVLAIFTQRGSLLQLWDLHAMRTALASMGLDWHHPQGPAPVARPYAPLRIEADLGFLASWAFPISNDAQP
jgi:serine/threonine protein kinase/WD40 repeat protein